LISDGSGASYAKDGWLSGTRCGFGRDESVIPNLASRISFSSRNALFSASNARYFSRNSLTFTTAILTEYKKKGTGYFFIPAASFFGILFGLGVNYRPDSWLTIIRQSARP
jgi:hypothetical protein